jgi:hypothetical protein
MLRRPSAWLATHLGEGCSSTAVTTWWVAMLSVWDNLAGRGSDSMATHHVVAAP